MRTSFAVLTLIALSICMSAAPGRGAFERTLTVSGPVDLDVLSDIGGLVLTGGPPGSVRVEAVLTPQLGPLDLVEATGRIRALEASPPIEQTGNRIRIGYPQNRQLLTRISMRLVVQVPHATVVRVRTDSGGIHVSGIAGPVDGESRSGRIVISAVTGDVAAKTQSGGIFVSKSQGRVLAQNGSGGIEAIDVSGGIDATTGSGAIRLSQTQPAPIRANARSGAIHVSLVPGAGYDFRAQSESGKVLISEVSGKNSRYLTGKLGTGGPLVDISTKSSTVSIKH